MSTYYQTTAKPRGRRDTGASETSARSRAPSESTNLAKNISRTSDENTHTRSAKSRPNSPATFLQRNRTLDRSSLLETILPKSSSSQSLKSIEAKTACESKAPPVIPVLEPNVSLSTSPTVTAAELESLVDVQCLKLRTSSKSMIEAAGLNARRSSGAPIFTPNFASDALEGPAAARDSTRINQNSTKGLSLQPSVADASEDVTPTPTPAFEHVIMPFNATDSPIVNQQVQPPHETGVPPQKEILQTLQQQNNDWYTDPVTQPWQTASPPQSPIIHQYGFQPPGQIQYPYDYSYGYPPNTAPAGYPQYRNSYYPAPFSPPAEAARPPVERSMSRSAGGDEQSELLNRIQGVLPDLARFLEQSRDVQAPLNATDPSTSRPQLEDNEQLTSLQQELDATKKEYERVIRNLVDENCTLKSEIEDRRRRSRSLEGDSRGSRKLKNEFEVLQAQHQDLASSVDSIRISKEELMAEKLGAEKYIEALKKDKHIIKDSHNRVITDLKQQHLRDLTSRDREHQRGAVEHKAILSRVQLDLATLITKHTNTKRELDLARSSETTHKASAEAISKDLDTAKLHHLQQSDRLRTDHQRTLESMKQEHKLQRQRHEREIKKCTTEFENYRRMEQEWDSASCFLRAEVQEQRLALAAERDAHASLKRINDVQNKRTADLAVSMTLWRQKHVELQKENNENLNRVLQALGFGSTAAESTPEVDPAAPDSVPGPISDEMQIILPSEGMLNISKFAEITQETAGTALPPPAELLVLPKKEESNVVKIEAILGPEKAREPVQNAGAVIAAEPLATSPATQTAAPIAREDFQKTIGTTRMIEKATKDSAKAAMADVQAAEEPITCRPIQYYQVPGQYH